ncbi:MAG: hypothetical protein QXZ70_03230 [Candidatus Bathyarchaeia archaeon]
MTPYDASKATKLRFKLRTKEISYIRSIERQEAASPKLKEKRSMELLRLGLSTHFLPYIKSEELKTFTERLIDLFAPRIIVGISDMLPPDGDIEKVRMISKIIAGYKI